MESMHSLLKRQLKRHLGNADAIPKEWEALIDAVNEAYRQMDTDREMLERTLDFSSQELIQANSEMRAVFQAFPDLLFRTDNKGTILDYQASATTDLHFLREKVIGKQIYDLFTEDIGKKFGKAIDQVQETRIVVSIEYSLAMLDNELFYEARLLPLFENQVIIIIRDITKRKRAEEALRESERRLSEIIDFAPDATFAINNEGRVIAWNRAIEEMTGVKASEMLGKGNYEYSLPFYGVRRPILIDLVFISDEEIREKYHFVRKEGAIITAEAEVPVRGTRRELAGKVSPLYDNMGKIVGAIESIRDITKRKRAEAALRDSEEKYRTLVENVNIGVYRNTGGPQGRFIEANPAMLKIFGYDSVEEFMGIAVSDLYQNQDDRKLFIEEITRNGFVNNKELPLRKKDGTPIWVSVNASVQYDENGGIKWMDGVLEDITERRLAEETVRESERRLADIIDFLPNATFVIDREGRVISWNHVIETMTGVKAEEILGKGDFEYALPFYGERRPILIDLVLKPDEEIEKRYARIERQPDGSLVGEGYIPNLKGGEFYFLGNAAPLYDFQGNLVGAIQSIRDITQRKKAEEELKRHRDNLEILVAERTAELAEARDRAEEADRLKSAFLATMSHELRTPLNSVIGFTGILLQGLVGPLNNEQRKQLNMVKSSANHLLDLINDVLDLSKIESGRMDLQIEVFDMNKLIDRTMSAMKPLAEKKKIILNSLVFPSVGRITSDPRRVQQILVNLIGNAIKFTDRGEVRIECAVSNGWLKASVIDTGIGIKPEDMRHLFETFRQIDSGLARLREGSGLGLAICRRLAEALGGGIQVESTWGVGSAFTLTLPAER